MRFAHALCRRPGPDFATGLTTSADPAPEYADLLRQHAAYVAALGAAGLAVEVLPPLAGCPDAWFVEDAALVLPELAVITRPGAPTRRGETATIAAALGRHRHLVQIEPPGTLDGGDVLTMGRHVLVGLSGRTNREGCGQLAAALAAHGYEVVAVPVGAGLHLKSSVNAVDEETLLATAELAGRAELAGYRQVIVPADEAYAANVLRVRDTLVIAAGYPRTRDALAPLVPTLVALEVSGARAMDGGLTCMSLRF